MSTPPDHTPLSHLAATLATSAGAASLINSNGAKYWTRGGDLKRASNATLSYCGVMLSIDYLTQGFDADAYVESVKSVTAGGTVMLPRLSEAQVSELCERIQQGWEVL